MMHGSIIIRFGIRNKQESPVQIGQEILVSCVHFGIIELYGNTGTVTMGGVL